ncbi:MAG TPA: hypothetical protein VK420_21265 [Longimicrobium sp.]|nr:hypothetical protein [Longimicrobium sp.]
MRPTIVQPDPKEFESTAPALESLDCEFFLKEYEEAYAKLRDDPAALAEFETERRAFAGDPALDHRTRRTGALAD